MRRRRSALSAAFAVVLLVVGQLAALAHEAQTRHVICPEHGEALEAVQLAGADDGCAQSHWIAVDGDRGAEHADCEISRALHQASAAPARVLHVLLGLAQIEATPVAAPRAPTVVSALYLIAPKTSPPSHAG